MLPIELKEFLHNLKDHDFDMCGQYKVDENEANKIVKQLDRLDSMFVNADEIKPDDEIFKDDYSDKNIQNGWIYCKDRLPEREYEAQMRGYYLTTNAYGSVNVTKYEFEGGGLGFGWGSDIMIVAWMPLPEPYKTESEDKECKK